MKLINHLAIAATAAALASTAQANNTITLNGTATNQPYVGLKVGRMDAGNGFEVSQVILVDDGSGNVEPKVFVTPVSGSSATGYGVYGGYNFDQHFGVEGEYQRSGKKEFVRSLAVGTGKFEQQVETYGAYGTYRHNFGNSPFYGKAKLGVARTNIDVQLVGDSGNKLEEHKTGTAYGLAAGYQAGNFGIEAGFSRPHKQVDVATLGAHLAF